MRKSRRTYSVSKRRSRGPRKGYVYVIGHDRKGPVKIGKTRNNPDRRLSQLQTGNPRELYLFGSRYVNNYHKVEQRAHTKLRRRRLKREWFNVSAEHALRTIDKSTVQTKNTAWSITMISVAVLIALLVLL